MKVAVIRLASMIMLGLSCGGCTLIQHVLNPFYEVPSDLAKSGERNDDALRGGTEKAASARLALENISTYQRTQDPQPVNPVMQPAIVRLMWIPDHLNKTGDLVPAHYYYLKVLDERWAVQDAFELESQLNGPKGGAASSLPFVYEQR